MSNRRRCRACAPFTHAIITVTIALLVLTATAAFTTPLHKHHSYERRTIVTYAETETPTPTPPSVEKDGDDSTPSSPTSSSSNTSPQPPQRGEYLLRAARGLNKIRNMKESVEPGDVVFAKVDIDALKVYRDVGYDVTSIYHQGLNDATGRIEKRNVASLDEPVPRGYTRYVTLYSPVHHGDDMEGGAVVVTPEEVGLVSMKTEVAQSLLLAVPGLFWVFVCIYFTNIYQERYGGTFMDAFLGT